MGIRYFERLSDFSYALHSIALGFGYCAIALLTTGYFAELMDYGAEGLIFDPVVLPSYFFFAGAFCFSVLDPQRAILGAVYSWIAMAVSLFLVAPMIDDCGMVELVIILNWLVGGGAIIFGALLGRYLGGRAKQREV